jgi:hypothetical protein
MGLVAQESRIGRDPQRPAVDADDEREDVARVASAHHQHDSGDHDEHREQPRRRKPPAVRVPSAEERGEHRVVRDGE